MDILLTVCVSDPEIELAGQALMHAGGTFSQLDVVIDEFDAVFEIELFNEV